MRTSLFSSSRLSAAALAITLAMTAPAASAAVVTWDVADVTTPISTANDANGVWFNLFTGSTTVVTNGSFLPFAHGLFELNYNGTAGYLNINDEDLFIGGGNWVAGPARLTSGTLVDSSLTFASNSGSRILASTEAFVNPWDGLGQGYLGFKFTDGSSTFYGYADIVVNANYTATLRGFAYQNTAGVGITTSAIPEPSTYAMIAAGAVLGAAMVARRRRS